MWSKTKSSTLTTILASTNAPLSVVVDTSNKADFSIQVNYGVGTATTAKLQQSDDGVNYIDVASSSQLLDIAGGSHMWNVTAFQPRYCKVVLTGDSVNNTVLLAVYG